MKKKLDKKLRTRVSNLIRRDLKKTPWYSRVVKKSFLGKTIYKCPICKDEYYTGSSQKNYDKLKEESPDLKRCKSSEFNMDHIEPVVPYDTDLHSMTLDEIAIRVYSKEDNLQYICSVCHKEKTAKEARIRKLYRDEKKLEKQEKE